MPFSGTALEPDYVFAVVLLENIDHLHGCITNLDKDVCCDPPLVERATQDKQSVGYAPFFGRECVQLLSYYCRRNKHIIYIWYLTPVRIIDRAICFDHCAFQDVFVRRQCSIQLLQLAQLGLQSRVCGLQCLLLGSERCHSSLIRGHHLACL